MTESSTLTPWYNTNYTPSGEVTTHTDEKPKGLSQALEVLDKEPQEPRPAPLSQLEPATNAEVCSPLMDALPDTIGEDYKRFDDDEDNTAAWGAEGREPVVIRCGVAPPEGYEPGAQLQQINEIDRKSVV